MKIPAAASLALLATPLPLLAAGGGGGLFAVDPGLSFWTIVIFLLVLFVLGKFAWRPILGLMEEREAGIRRSIDEAREMRVESEKLLEEHRKQLAEARREAQELVAQGREVGERVRREAEANAREEAERILEGARREIERERDRALETIRTEAVDLALAAAAQLLDQKLDRERDRALIESYLQQMEAAEEGARPTAEA